jgi:hypothetical protein
MSSAQDGARHAQGGQEHRGNLRLGEGGVRICYLIVNSEIPSDRGARGRAVRAKIVRPFLYFVGINFASLVDI